MNGYARAMGRISLPEGMEDRLRTAALTAEPEARIFRPRGFRRKAAVLAALIAAALLSTGAAALWDEALNTRFGAMAAYTVMGESAFQEVNQVSVCGDVTVTLSHALVNDQSAYLVVYYQLPESVDLEQIQRVRESEGGGLVLPHYDFYATGDYTWQGLRERDQAAWEAIDWGDFLSYCSYLTSDGALANYRLDSYGSSGALKDYDPETGTLKLFLRLTLQDYDRSLGDQPLTLLLTSPLLQQEGKEDLTLVDHPALIVFQPEFTSQTVRGTVQDGGTVLRATLSPFALTLEGDGLRPLELRDDKDLIAQTSLVDRDGRVRTLRFLGASSGGSSCFDAESGIAESLSTSVEFFRLLDVSQVRAVRIGELEILLE